MQLLGSIDHVLLARHFVMTDDSPVGNSEPLGQLALTHVPYVELVVLMLPLNVRFSGWQLLTKNYPTQCYMNIVDLLCISVDLTEVK